MSRTARFASIIGGLVAVVAALGFVSAAPALAHPGDTSTINACVNRYDGSVRIPASGGCRFTETATSWNHGESGPQIDACINRYDRSVRIVIPAMGNYGGPCRFTEIPIHWHSDGTDGGASGTYNRWDGQLFLGSHAPTGFNFRAISWS